MERDEDGGSSSLEMGRKWREREVGGGSGER